MIINHHTTKTNNRDTSGWRHSDWMYAGAGSADMTNWARAILTIDPTVNPVVFKFIAAKRGKRLNWADEDGNPEFVRCFAHRADCLAWREATAEESTATMKTASATGRGKTAEDLFRLIPLPPETIGLHTLETAAQKIGIGEKRFRRFRNELTETEQAFEHRFSRAGKRHEIRLARHQQTLL